MTCTSRRRFLKTIPQTLATGALVGGIPRFLVAQSSSSEFDYVITAQEATFSLRGKPNLKGLGFNGTYPAPVIKAKQGQRIRIKLVNKLSKATTIHWHGVRLENKMDGVPFLTQKPVQPGESFVYDFETPDAGTFWYHPHINSLEQLSKGLTGVLLVEETTKPPFDQDHIVQLKNWNVKDNHIQTIWAMKKAARGGTIGKILTVNGQDKLVVQTEVGHNVRLRLANLDNSVIYDIRNINQEAFKLLAVDSNPFSSPQTIDAYELGAGSRIDLGFRSLKPGVFSLKHGTGSRQALLVEIQVVKAKSKAKAATRATLPPNPIAKPDYKKAQTLRFSFEWSGAMTPKDGSQAPSFWAINKISWQGFQNGKKPKPLATLKLGRSYIFEFKNETPNRHPIHLHGLFFEVFQSNKKKITPYFADTVLMDKNETVKVALVADNIGDWMFHCHIVEHLKTGFMGYISVV